MFLLFLESATIANLRLLMIVSIPGKGSPQESIENWRGNGSGTHVNSSFCFLVTSHWRHILSSGRSFLRAVLCMIAVSRDWGLKNPASQTQEGSYGNGNFRAYVEPSLHYDSLTTKSVDHVSSSRRRRHRSMNQLLRPKSEGYARCVQMGGT